MWGRNKGSSSDGQPATRAERREAALREAERTRQEAELRRQHEAERRKAAAEKAAQEEQARLLDSTLREHDVLDSRCREHVVPRALRMFSDGQQELPPPGHPEFLASLWLLHMEAIVVPYTERVNPDLRTLPLVIMTPRPAMTPRDALMNPREIYGVMGWWYELVREHAEMCSMDEDEFGDHMTEGFATMYNQAVRRFNLIMVNAPTYHQYVRMTPAERARLDDPRKRAEMETGIAANFCLAYGYAFRPGLADEILNR